MPRIFEITTELCRVHFSRILSEFAGPGRPWSYENAAEALGIEYKTLVAYCLGQNLPKLPTLLRMFKLFGPEFANRVLRLSEMEGARRQTIKHIPSLSLNKNLATTIGEVGRALADGHIDHIECAAIKKELSVLLSVGADWMTENDCIPCDKTHLPHDDAAEMHHDMRERLDA